MPIQRLSSKMMKANSITADQLSDNAIHGRRNLIINGAMQVAQRGTSSTSSGYGTVDRWGVQIVYSQWAWTQEQSSDAPDGFSNSYKITTTTAESVIDAGDLLNLNHEIEAQNLQHLKYGTSSAETCTLSFWVKSSITGVFGISLYQGDGPYILTPTYTINAANTWEYKTISISGNTLGGPANDNGPGIRVSFILAAGSNYNDGTSRTSWESYSATKFGSGHVQNGVMTTLNATWQVTGVQLEVGDKATPFEHRSYGDELARCQRYYYEIGGTATNDFAQKGYQAASQYAMNTISHPTTMRAAPTLTKSGTFAASNIGEPSAVAASITNFVWQAQKNGSTGAWNFYSNSSGKFTLDAEL